jgi:TatD DNase family protein
VCIGSGSGAADVLGAARDAAQVAARYPGYISYSVGIHPHDASGFDASRDVEALRGLASAGAVALGECGLDYHYDNSPRPEQRRAFAEQLALAQSVKLPVVVHTRDAEDDTRAMVSDAGAAGIVGVLHCFTGTRSLAEAALAAGWYVSFSGIVTFKKWTDDDLLRAIPDDRILAESDSPYLAPVPHRGKRNEPAWVSFTVARLAAARGVTAEVMGERVTVNARRLFNLAAPALT